MQPSLPKGKGLVVTVNKIEFATGEREALVKKIQRYVQEELDH